MHREQREAGVLPRRFTTLSCHSCLRKRRSRCTHERNASRGPARSAELSWRSADHLAGFFRIHHLADPARAATCNPAVRAGVSSRDGSEPDRRLATETPRTALRRCHSSDVCADCCHDDHHPVCHSAAEPTTAGTHAQHAKHVARHPHPDRVANERLSGSSRGVTTDG